MKKFLILSCVGLALVLGNSGCASAQKKQMTAISRGVYATKDSIEKGRFDLAKKYNDELVRIVPPPKKAVKVNAFEVPNKKGKVGTLNSTGIFSKEELLNRSDRFIVLPEGFENKPIIIDKSVEYNKLLEENASLRKSELENAKTVESFKQEATKVIQAKEAELAQAKRKSIFGWLLATLGFLGIGGIIGVVVLFALFPALQPVIGGVFSVIIRGINSFTGMFARMFKKSPTIT